MLVESWYDTYLGVIARVLVVDGKLTPGMKIRMMGTGATHFVDKVGAFTPKMVNLPALGPGELGFINASIKSVADRSEEHTSELQSLMRISYAVFCLKKKNINTT